MSLEAADAQAEFPAASEFLRGVRASIPIVIAILPFAILFGVLAQDAGLSIFETVLMSATVFAGASQLVGIELFDHHVAPWMIVLSIFAVNFRHVLYSAALGRQVRGWPSWRKAVGFFFLVDTQFAECERRLGTGRPITFAWYMGLGLSTYVLWVVNSWLGAAFGSLLPDLGSLGIAFLLPIYFLGLVMGFRTRPLFFPVVGASAAASILAYETIGSPWHVTVGALAGILVAVIVPVRSEGSARP